MTDQSESRLETSTGMAGVMQRNIRAVLERREAEARRKSRELRIADVITRFTGSMRFVYIHLVLFGSWIIANLPSTPFPKFDPSFVVLAMFASVEAIFLSTFVLISQNRMAEQADKRADLDLQINLLAEHEVTKLLAIVDAIAARLDVETPERSDVPALTQDVVPGAVLEEIEDASAKIAHLEQS